MEPGQIKAYAENQIEVTKSRGEYSSARCWENIAQAAGELINLAARIESKR